MLFVLSCGDHNIAEKESRSTEEVIVEDTLRVIFGGDVMFDRGIKSRVSRTDSIFGGGGYDSLFSDIAPIFYRADYVSVNLETPVADTPSPMLKKFVFNADTAVVRSLKQAGVDILNLANNHTVDHGKVGLGSTLRWILNNGLIPVGAGQGALSCEPLTISSAKRKIMLFSVNMLPLERWLNNSTGFCICMPGTDELQSRIKEVRREFPDVFIVLQLHWGAEYHTLPMPDQIAVARRLSDAGADLIVGHHPHVVQQITRINGMPVFFSVGNLIFDSRRPEAQRTCLLEVEVVNHRMNFILYPLKLVNGAPTIMSKDETTDYQVHIESISPAIVLHPQGDHWRLEFRSDPEGAEAPLQPE